MLVELEVSTKEILRQLLLNHSVEALLEMLADQIQHPEPEWFATEANKLLMKTSDRD